MRIRDGRFRKESFSQAAMEQARDSAESISDVFEVAYRQQLLIRAAEAIQAEFRETTWQAFWLSYIEGLPIADVAERLGVSVGSVYVSRSRIVRATQNKVKQIQDEED